MTQNFKTNSQQLVRFFKMRSSTGWRGGGRKRTFGDLSNEEVYKLIRLLSDDVSPIEDLLKFVKGHRKVAREMTFEDVSQAINELATEEVLKS